MFLYLKYSPMSSILISMYENSLKESSSLKRIFQSGRQILFKSTTERKMSNSFIDLNEFILSCFSLVLFLNKYFLNNLDFVFKEWDNIKKTPQQKLTLTTKSKNPQIKWKWTICLQSMSFWSWVKKGVSKLVGLKIWEL